MIDPGRPRITFQWIEPCPNERLRVAQQRLLESVQALGLEPSLLPAGPEMVRKLLAVPNQFVWPAQVGVAGSAALAAFGLFVSSVRRNVLKLLVLAVPLLGYVPFWFFTAPDVRYFGPALWIFAVCPGLAFAGRGERGWD
jgi:hypothetical protein